MVAGSEWLYPDDLNKKAIVTIGYAPFHYVTKGAELGKVPIFTDREDLISLKG